MPLTNPTDFQEAKDFDRHSFDANIRAGRTYFLDDWVQAVTADFIDDAAGTYQQGKSGNLSAALSPMQ